MFDVPSDQAFESFIDAQRRRDVLRFITCGSVDDGKSTLIGRLLHDANQLFEDQVTRLRQDSRRFGTQDGGIDYALLVDGLAAEREQGITIDVAYRFFATDKRCFVVADTPGHEQYTRNMATGASTADLAVLLVDARKGLSRQTRRHSLILSMLGVRNVVLAVNKMDLIGWSQNRFDRIVAEYAAYADSLGFTEMVGIPLSALSGDNVVHPGIAAPWYEGPTLLRYIESVPAAEIDANAPFRFCVQWVNRRRSDFRGYAGFVSSGKIRVGDRIRIQRSEQEVEVTRIITYDGDLDEAAASQSVTLVLSDEVDVSRGDVLTSFKAERLFADRLSARLFWTGERPLVAGERFELKLATATRRAMVERVTRRLDPDSGEQEDADRLVNNDIGDIVLGLDWPLTLEPYARSRDLGSFILIDREHFDTVGIGLVLEPDAPLAPGRGEQKGRSGLRSVLRKLGFGSGDKGGSALRQKRRELLLKLLDRHLA
jgi:sulfate adenylyltransferase subunit 1